MAEASPAPAWETSAWERPLTPSGMAFPYRQSMSLSPKRPRGPSTTFESREGPFLTHLDADQGTDEDEELYRPSSPPAASDSPPSQYTVQYIGLAKGELGVLSKREVGDSMSTTLPHLDA